MARSFVGVLLVCSLVAACQKTEAPAPATASTSTSTSTAQATAGPPLPQVCKTHQQECKPLSQCATYPITNAAAEIPTQTCTAEDVQDPVDIYSWNLFLALNWPARLGNCDANKAKNILDVRSGDGTFVVWQTYMPSENVFVNPGTKRPAAWCSQNGLAAGDQRVFTELAKAVPFAKTLGGPFVKISQPGGTPLQAAGGVLTDQSGRWVRYERLMNQVEYNYIVPNRWNAIQLQAMKDRKEDIVMPEGVIEIKAAWKVLTAAEIASKRYFTTRGYVCNDPFGNRTECDAQPVTMGLVGLHLVQETHDGGTMFWSTFEQVDNESVFWNPNIIAPINTDFAKQPYEELDKNCKARNQPTQVKRIAPIPATPALNTYYQQLLGNSVFANYRLISTQWTTGAGPSAFGTPANVANITLETYVQSNEPPTNKPTGCFGCHLKSSTVIRDQNGGHSFFFLQARYATKGQ